MGISRIFGGILIAVLVTLTILPSTLARYSEVFSGVDTSLIAKWNISARGEDDIASAFYNKGFTFDLFNSQSIEPMDFGEKSFTFRGGGSDVAIAYDVKMNAADLLKLTTDQTKATIAKASGKDVYAPFIFKITAAINPGATDTVPTVFSPYDTASPYYGTGWFRPKDIACDEQGYFSIFSGTPSFSAGSNDEVTITVYWQWNTSYYINETGIAAASGVNPDPATTLVNGYLPYFWDAYDAYYGNGGLQDQYEDATNAVGSYLAVHGTPNSDGTWPLHNINEAPCSLTDADHITQYNNLVRAADNAAEDCETSLLKAYDDYDTFAADALDAKGSVKVLFSILGDQIAPQ